MADGPQQTREQRRHDLVARIETDQRGKLRLNTRNRWTYLDLARMDMADYLSTTDSRTEPGDQLPTDADAANPAAASGLDRMKVLTRAVMEETWPEVSAGIDNLIPHEPDAADVKRRLADHAWCTLLVALIRLIEKADEVASFVAAAARTSIKAALLRHFNSTRFSRRIADAVIDIVVEKVWSALTRLLEAHFPLLGSDTLRVLRMLTVFACPSVEKHPEVYKHAVEPLMNDGLKVITEDVKAQMTTLFTAWWRRTGLEPA